MRYFQKLASNIDVVPLLHAITRSNLWNQERLRTTHPGTPHTQVDDILLRFNDLVEARSKNDIGLVIDEHESINHPAMYLLPIARPIIFDLMRRVEGERLGRVLVTRLAPGRTIAEHVDGGDHAAYYQRYHVMLQNSPGSIFKAGNEAVYMEPGSCWWFDNAAPHSVVNNGVDDRITLIVDVRTFR